MLEEKLIIMDLDGTLLTTEKTISALTKKALLKAQADGAKLILASGRPLQGMISFAAELEMDAYGGYLIAFNGAQVMDCKTQSILYNQTMSVSQGQAILNHIKQFDVIPMIVREDYTYVHNVFAGHLVLNGQDVNIIDYEAHSNKYKLCEVDDLATFADFPLHKILLAGQPDYLEKHYLDISAPFTGVNAMFTAPFYYEFTAQGIDKAKALTDVFTPLNYSPAQMIAFGDAQNDSTMLNYVGIGIAMGNAINSLKETAQHITKTNDEDGIAYALEELL